MVEDRITALEQHAAALEDRVRELESTRHGARWDKTHPEVPAPSTHWPPPRRPAPAPPRAMPIAPPPPGVRTKPKRELEDVLGGSVLAWLGGIAVLAGLAFLLTIAISRGWLGEGTRTVLAGLFSAGLLGAGVWLREHKDRTEAALAASAVGVAGLFGTLLIAGAVYELVPTAAALAGAFVVGAGATLLATRWDAALMGWLGLLGALWAPLALGAIDNAGALAFLAIAYTATIAVVLWQRWTALAWAAFATTTLQWLGWVASESPTSTAIVVALVTFGTLTAVLAFGLEARDRATPHAAALLVIDALLLAAAHGDEHGWLIALAAAHLVAGLAATRVPRISRTVALVALGIGVGLADLVLVAMTDGLPVALGWAGPVLAFAALLGARRRPPAMDKLARELRAAFLGAPRETATGTAGDAGRAAPAARESAPGDAGPSAPESAPGGAAASARESAPGGAAASARESAPGDAAASARESTPRRAASARARLAAPPHPRVARLVDATLGRPSSADWYFAALGLVAQLALAIGHVLAAEAPLDALAGPAAGTEALVAVGAIGVAAFLGARLSGVALLDVLALTALAHLTGLVFEGLPLTVALAAEGALLALVSQRASLAFAALAAVHALATLAPPLALVDGLDEPLQAAAALAAVIAALATTRLGRRAAPVALLYLASVQVVTAGGAEHTGQTLLSVLWALTGVGALVYGLVADHRTTRLVALGLLALTAAKVFLYDLSELDSLARVASFIVFGVLLLLGAFAWQRVRPRALP